MIRLHFLLILNKPHSVADKFEVLTSIQTLNSAELFLLEAKAANVSIALILVKIVMAFLSHKSQVVVRLCCSWPCSL